MVKNFNGETSNYFRAGESGSMTRRRK